MGLGVGVGGGEGIRKDPGRRDNDVERFGDNQKSHRRPVLEKKVLYCSKGRMDSERKNLNVIGNENGIQGTPPKTRLFRSKADR